MRCLCAFQRRSCRRYKVGWMGWCHIHEDALSEMVEQLQQRIDALVATLWNVPLPPNDGVRKKYSTLAFDETVPVNRCFEIRRSSLIPSFASWWLKADVRYDSKDPERESAVPHPGGHGRTRSEANYVLEDQLGESGYKDRHSASRSNPVQNVVVGRSSLSKIPCPSQGVTWR